MMIGVFDHDGRAWNWRFNLDIFLSGAILIEVSVFVFLAD